MEKIYYKKINPVLFAVAIMIGMLVAVGVSVWATSIGTNVSVTGNFDTGGNSTFGDASGDINIFTGTLQASTTALFTGAVTFYNNAGFINVATTTVKAASVDAWNIATSSANIPFLKFDTSNYRLGISTTSPGATLAVGGAGDVYALGSLTIDGNTVLGNASTDTLRINANSVTYGNAGTSTIPSANANAWNIATSSANIPFLKYDTSNYRIGIGTTSPGATLAVGGDMYVSGTASFGPNGTPLTQIQSGTVHCGPIVASQSIAATSTGVIACWSNISGVNSGDKVFLTATSTAIVSQGSVVLTGKASTTAANFIQAEVMNFTGAAWTVATTSMFYLLVR